MEHKQLRKVQKLLSGYFTYFKSDNILVVSEDKAVLPFAYLILDDSYPNNILLSIAVDYPNSINVTDVALMANNILSVILTDPFYISSNTGETYFNEEALERWDLDSIDLTKIDPISNVQH